MSKIPQIIQTLTFTFLLFFTVNTRNCVFFGDVQFETSIENPRQCSADDVAGRLSKTFPSRAARQLKNAIRYPNRFFQSLFSPVVFHVKKSIVSNTTPNIAFIVPLTTVLRI
jgi:hypothetical protein